MKKNTVIILRVELLENAEPTARKSKKELRKELKKVERAFSLASELDELDRLDEEISNLLWELKH